MLAPQTIWGGGFDVQKVNILKITHVLNMQDFDVVEFE